MTISLLRTQQVAATWEGIEAVRILESQHDIRCNCTLVFAVAQAAACAEAGATLISPFVGRITDWYAAHEGRGYADTPEADPGVLAVTAIYDHLKDPTTGLGRTEIMAASLRNAGQARRRRCAVRDAGCCCCADNGGGNAARIE